MWWFEMWVMVVGVGGVLWDYVFCVLGGWDFVVEFVYCFDDCVVVIF